MTISLNLYLPWWAYLIVLIYVLYAVLFIRFIKRFFTYRLPVFDRIEKLYDKKYLGFSLKCRKNLSKVSMIICGLTLAPIRFISYFACVIIYTILFRIL